jgi:hypothetical protein
MEAKNGTQHKLNCPEQSLKYQKIAKGNGDVISPYSLSKKGVKRGSNPGNSMKDSGSTSKSNSY